MLLNDFDDCAPTITPSAIFAIFPACFGVLIPKPTAMGIVLDALTTSIIDAKSVLISLLIARDAHGGNHVDKTGCLLRNLFNTLF